MCRGLLAIDLNLLVEDYVQPYEGVCVVIPGTVIGVRKDVLAASYWRPGIGLIIGCFVHPLVLYISLAEGSAGTIEEVLSDDGRSPGVSEDDKNRMRRVARIVVNACLFGVERGVRVHPLDRKSRERKKRADQVRRGCYEGKVVEIQNLDLILLTQATSTSSTEGTGGRCQQVHRRRGHWKMQVCGPGRSQRKRIFVHSYMVHADEAPKAEVHSVLT
jgi:hypothetical protein